MNLELTVTSTRCHSNESWQKKTPPIFFFLNIKGSSLQVLKLSHDNILEINPLISCKYLNSFKLGGQIKFTQIIR